MGTHGKKTFSSLQTTRYFIHILFQMLYMSIVLFAPALALNAGNCSKYQTTVVPLECIIVVELALGYATLPLFRTRSSCTREQRTLFDELEFRSSTLYVFTLYGKRYS